MSELFEEYGGVIVACITGLIIVGILYAMMTPGNPLGDGVRTLMEVGLGDNACGKQSGNMGVLLLRLL